MSRSCKTNDLPLFIHSLGEMTPNFLHLVNQTTADGC